MLCSRDSHHCNTRRLAEGNNHTHPVVIRAPPTDLSLYDALIQVNVADELAGEIFHAMQVMMMMMMMMQFLWC